jgi:AraC-like DNA-binding protein
MQPMSETIAIKNMVCRRCIMAVEQLLAQLGITPRSVALGQVVLERPLTEQQRNALAAGLAELGFELLDDRRKAIVSSIKTGLIELIRSGDEELLGRVVISEYLEQQLGMHYSTLSRLFSQVEGKTIERFVIEQKIELVKELIAYNELSLTEISYRLGYSSVHHLSSQFKQVTGMTARQFRQLHTKPRRPIDQI